MTGLSQRDLMTDLQICNSFLHLIFWDIAFLKKFRGHVLAPFQGAQKITNSSSVRVCEIFVKSSLNLSHSFFGDTLCIQFSLKRMKSKYVVLFTDGAGLLV